MVLKYKDMHALDNYKTMKIIYSKVRSPYIEHAASRLPNPTRLEGAVRFIQAQDQQVLPHVGNTFSHVKICYVSGTYYRDFYLE